MKTTVIGFIRYSSKGLQALGHSEARQEGGLAAFVASINGTLWPELYCDRGRSAFHGHHRQHDFGRLLADVEACKFPAGSILYFEDMDRFSREKIGTVMSTFDRILAKGYRLGVDGKIYTSDTPSMELTMPIMKAILARDESEKKSKRLKASWKAKRDAGAAALTKRGAKARACPSWIAAKGAEYVLNDKAPLYKRACLMAIAGRGKYSIEKELGIACNIFRQRTLIGEYQPKHTDDTKAGEAISNYYPALLTEQEFYALQASLDSRILCKQRRTGEHCSNLFTGLIKSAAGEEICLMQRSSGVKVLMPSRATRKGKATSLHYQGFEDYLLSYILAITPEHLEPVRASETLAQIKVLEGKIARNKANIAQWCQIASESPTVASLIVSAEKEIEELVEAMECLKTDSSSSSSANLEACQSMIKYLAGLTGNELTEARIKLKAIISTIIQEITITIKTPKHAYIFVSLKHGKTADPNISSKEDLFTIGEIHID